MGSEQSGAEGSYGLLRGSCQRKDMGDSRGSIGMGGLDKRASILGLGTLSHGYPCGVHLEYTIPLDQRYSLVAWTHPGRRLEARRRAFRDTPRSWQTSGDSVCINSLDPLCPLIGCWLTINGSIPSSGGAVTLLRKRIRPRYACLDQRGQTSKADRLDGPRIRACCNLWCSHCDVSGSTTVVTYDGCIKNHERSENFPTMNERVARELIRAIQHVCLKKN